jgi:chromosome segregation ATPase
VVETAIYVLLGALTTALVALLALPAVSRRAFRLAQARARLVAPLSEAQAQAERDALRGRHAVELALAERRAEAAEDKSAAAQIELGRRAAEIVRRDLDIKDKAEEIARQRAEISALTRELAEREADVAAHEAGLRDFESQRDAAEARLAATTAQLNYAQAEAARTRAALEQRIEALTRELGLSQRLAESELLAAKATIADLERRLEEGEADAAHLRRQIAELAETPLSPSGAAARAVDVISRIGNRLAEAAQREKGLTVRLQALAEAEASARADRDQAQRDLERLSQRLSESEARAERLSDADDSLRQAIARLGRELVAERAAEALVDSRRERAS